MNHEVFKVTLAALLHDIGKLYQRADKGDKSKLSVSARGMADRVRRGDNTYAHCLWTVECIEKHWGTLSRFIKNKDKFVALAACHHNPDTQNPSQQIIAMADRASAGMDREDDPKSKNGRMYYSRQLDSLFGRIKKHDSTWGHKPGALSRFPEQSVDAGSVEAGYVIARNAFDRGIASINAKNEAQFLECLTTLVRRTCWGIPSSTMENIADIPLCDHMTTTAAIAAVIARAHFVEAVEPAAATFRLVTGDVSGIQQFIFSMTGESNRGAARLLRGRSFAVSLMTRLASQALVDACGLPHVCTVLNAGGRFGIIIADTAECRAALKKACTDIDFWQTERFFGDARIVVDSGVSFGIEDFKLPRFQNVLTRAARSAETAKMRALVHRLKVPDAWIDNQRSEQFARVGACPVCGHEPASTGGGSGSNCELFRDWGTKLAKCRYVIVYPSKQPDMPGGYATEIADAPGGEADIGMVWRINEHLGDIIDGEAVLEYSNFCPSVEGDDSDEAQPVTFEVMAEKAGDRGALPALAALKMDVDNMGNLFAFEFGDALSVSRHAALSRTFNSFFVQWLPRYLKESYPDVYTLFAGGDDLCLIGAWDEMVQLMQAIREHFARFVTRNPFVTLSAGLELFHPGYPLARAVPAAEKLLEKAKDNVGKDSVTLLGHTLKWGSELDSQLNFVHEWEGYTRSGSGEEKGGGNSMLYRFLRYRRNHDRYAKDPLKRLRHRFQLIYDINRNVDKNWKNREPFASLCDTSVTSPLEQQPFFRFLPVGISIAMYKTRNKNTPHSRSGE